MTVKFTFGIHPSAISRPGDISRLKWLLCNKKVVANGELGFTFPSGNEAQQRQRVKDLIE